MNLTDKTFLQRALHAYDNPQCLSIEEFQEDLERFSHIKKLVTKFRDGQGDLNERLIINHLVIALNVFGDEAVNFTLLKIDRKQWPVIFPFFILLNRLPDYLHEFRISTDEISLDQRVIERLRKI